jgi:outer membrane biosynthesis protein TonB
VLCTKNIALLKQKQHAAGVESAQNATKLIAAATASIVVLAVISGCKSRPMAPHTPPQAPPVSSAPAPAAPPVAAASSTQPMVASWADYRRRAAQMIVAANPDGSFSGPQPAQWQGIATVTVFLNADGSVKSLDLMRSSRIAPHVNDLALAAVRRTANYGTVRNLPQPWQFNETFLYNDDNKFQLVTIVEGR